MTTTEVACLVHIADNRLLLTESSKNPGTYYMPGGKIEPGEAVEQALWRELQEELNITLQPATIRFYGAFRAQAFNRPPGHDVIDHCYFADFSGTMAPSAEIRSFRYFSPEEYRQLPQQAPAVLLIFDALLKDGLLKGEGRTEKLQ